MQSKQVQNEREPVAVRVKFYGVDRWALFEKPPELVVGDEMEPLYAAPSPASDLQKRVAELEEALRKETELRKATLAILYNDETEAFVGTHWVKPINPAAGTWPVLCINFPSWGADADEVPDDQLVLLADLIKRFGPGAAIAWSCFRRGLDSPVKGDLSNDGKEALAELRARTALEQKP
jgi:hypothetical protein